MPVWNTIDAHWRGNALDELVMPAQPLQLISADIPCKEMMVRVERLGGLVEFKFANAHPNRNWGNRPFDAAPKTIMEPTPCQ